MKLLAPALDLGRDRGLGGHTARVATLATKRYATRRPIADPGSTGCDVGPDHPGTGPGSSRSRQRRVNIRGASRLLDGECPLERPGNLPIRLCGSHDEQP